MSSRVRELVRLVIALRESDEDPEVVFSGRDLDARARELCRQLVEPASREALLWAIDEEGRYRWVMRCLFCKI
jgi:hypothetical protein